MRFGGAERLSLGAKRETLRAKLFGGARLNSGLIDVGSNNATFARDYLRREGIRYFGGSTGGEYARKIQFWPGSGRARQAFLPRATEPPRPSRWQIRSLLGISS